MTSRFGYAIVPLSLLFLSAWSPARAEIIHQFVQAPEDCPPMVWFQAQGQSQPAPTGHSGMLALGMDAYASPGFPPALWGGWFSWTPDGAFLSYAGGTLSTTDIRDPGGSIIRNVRGATALASALDVMVDMPSGDIFAVTLYSGLLFWTPEHVYLLLVGGVPTVYEVTDPSGAPIPRVIGIARLAAQVLDNDPGPAVDAILWSGALIYSDTHLYLTRTHTVVSTDEIRFAGAPIAGIRGILPMGGAADSSRLDAAAYLWTANRVLLHVTGGSGGTTEVRDPAGASIADTWGMIRQTRRWSGNGSFGGAITLYQPQHQYFVTPLGTAGTTEVLSGTGAPLRTDVRVPAGAPLLHQAGSLMEVLGTRSPTGGLAQRGTIIGLGQ